MIHRHKWVLVAKTYAPPPQFKRVNTDDMNTVLKLAMGLTEFLWECEICHKIRKESLLGEELNDH